MAQLPVTLADIVRERVSLEMLSDIRALASAGDFGRLDSVGLYGAKVAVWWGLVASPH